VQKEQTNLSIYANYRHTENSFTNSVEKSLNSKIIFNQQLLNRSVNLGSVYETASGNISRQEFIYIETEPGLGLLYMDRLQS
jgi:hypothetical protein